MASLPRINMKNIIKNPPPEYEEDIELNKKVNKRLDVNICVSQKRKHVATNI